MSTSTRRPSTSSTTESLASMRSTLDQQQQLIEKQQQELKELRARLDHLAEINESQSADLSRKLSESISLSDMRRLQSSLADVQDRLYEMDKSWRNNVLFYGVPTDEDEDVDNAVTEDKIRRLLSHKLRISRDVAISRVSRLWHGPDVRGQKPVQVCLVHYRDKEAILRQARLLRGSNVFVSEDFSRRVRTHRHELLRFMKELRARDPGRKMTLRHDKLYVGHKDIFFFNDLTNRVEKLHNNNNNINGNHWGQHQQQQQMHEGTQQLIDDLLVQDVQSGLRDTRGGPSWLHRSPAHNPRSFTSPHKSAFNKNFVANNEYVDNMESNSNFSYPASPATQRRGIRPTASARPGHRRVSSSRWSRVSPSRSAGMLDPVSPRRRAVVFKDLPHEDDEEEDEILELTTDEELNIMDNIGNARFEVIDRSVATLPPIRNGNGLNNSNNVNKDVNSVNSLDTLGKERMAPLPSILHGKNGELRLAVDERVEEDKNNKKMVRLALVGQFEVAKARPGIEHQQE